MEMGKSGKQSWWGSYSNMSDKVVEEKKPL